MWPFGKQTARRREIRRSKAERRGAWYRRLSGRIPLWSSALTFGSAVVAALILSAGGDVLDIRAGQTLPRAITSRVDFSVEDAEQTAEKRVRARDSAPIYYRLDESRLADLRNRLMSALALAKEHAGEPEELKDKAAKIKIFLDEAGLAELQRLAELPDARRYQDSVDRAMRALARQPLVQAVDLGGRTAIEAILIDPINERERSVDRPSDLLHANAVENGKKVAEAAMLAFPGPLRDTIRNSITAVLAGDTPEEPLNPLYRYERDRSRAAADEAYASVPTQFLTYQQGAILANHGVVTEKEVELLEHEWEEYRGWAQAAGERGWGAMLGRSVLVFLVVIGLAVYIARFQQPKMMSNLVRQSTTALVLLALLALGRLAFVNSGAPHLAVGSQAFAAALLGIIYAHGSVFAITGALAVLMTLATQQGVGFCVVLLAVSGVLLFGLRTVRNRGKIVGVGAAAGLVALATTVAVGLINHQTLAFVWKQGLWAAGATLAAGFIVEGILPAIERAFRLSTGMTLLEWCDASKRLLRMMAADAPGTYNHSLLVGALAESAAEAVGANGLRARAGAYYHDIGKLNKPEYFVENQHPADTRHDRLSPAMSHLVIIGHVKDGTEMAKEYGLPASLQPFIAEHHGTTIIEYFYHAASKARKPGDAEVSDTEFRYAGPKPQSRETAIVMLCDGVEGAVRAMTEPTPGRIETVVSQIIRKRLADDQFDECDLTFRELATIERSLVKSLCSIYHARIVYPEKEEGAKPAESRAS